MFLLKLVFATVCSSFFHTVNNFSCTFCCPISSFFRVKKLVLDWDFQFVSKSSIYTLSNDFTFDGTAWKSKKCSKRYIHQFVRQSLQPQHTCHVHFHLNILNTNGHLQLLVFISPYMHCILKFSNQMKIAFLFR